MQLELSSFQTQQLEKANWQGTFFESARRELLLNLYPDELPDELVDLTYYAEREDFFKSHDAPTMQAIMREAQQLL